MVGIPSAEVRPASPRDLIRPTLEAGRSLKIRLADDHEIIRRVVSLMLKDLDVDLATAADGRDARARFAPGRCDGVLMDMQMAIMDGLEAVARSRTAERAAGAPRRRS